MDKLNAPRCDKSGCLDILFDVPGSFGTVPCTTCLTKPMVPGTQPAAINDLSSIVGLYGDAIGNTHGFQLMILHANYALVATSTSCSAITLSGGAYVDSYNSDPADGTPFRPADIATNGGVSVSGGSTVSGTLYVPTPAIDSCSQPAAISSSQTLWQPLAPEDAPLSMPPASTNSKSYSSKYTFYPVQYPDPASTDTTSPEISYGNLTFLAPVTFTPGVYTINSINASGGVQITIQGPVVINLQGQNLGTKPVLSLSGGSTFVNPGKPADLVITYNGSQPILLSGGSQASGLLYAPNAAVTMSGSSPWSGANVSRSYTASGGAPLHYDIQLGK